MRFDVLNTANQALQGEINRSIIFNYIRENGPVSRMEIARKLHISASAVSRVVKLLILQQYVLETEKIETPVGKRPMLLQINEKKGSVLAVDLSQERIQIALYDFAGNLLSKYKGFRIRGRRESADELIEEAQHFLERYMHESELSFEELGLSAIGIGVPADIDTISGAILSACLYASWYDVNFKEMFEQKFKIPTFVDKDVILSALSEKRVGLGRLYRNLVFTEISNGVSAGIICNDQLVRGASGSAGQIAFSVINSESKRFRGKNLGYLDSHASVASLSAQIYAKLQDGRESSLSALPASTPKELDAALICQAALDEDELAIEVIGEIVDLLSSALINLVLVVNPEILILGGYISTMPGAQQLFGHEIARRIAEAIPFKVPEVRISKLGDEVVLVGASLLAVEALIAGEFPYRLFKEATTYS